jgi:purine-binding chemotaxis protein CheW
LDSSASNAEASQPTGPQLLLFRVGEDLLACDIGLVREIVRFAPLTRLPGAPPFVRGLLNVRGDVLSVLDVGIKLHPERAPLQTGAIIVVQTQGRQTGLVVDEVLGVQTVPGYSTEESATEISDIVRRAGHLDGRIVLYLNVPAFVNQSLV